MTHYTTKLLKKTASMLTIVVFVAGCGPTSNYYMLSMPQQPAQTYAHLRAPVGVEKVSVPSYFAKRQLALVKSSSQIGFMSQAVWAEDMDAGLTHRLIGFLQKKFQQPDVYAYPWGVDKQPELKVKVQITRFIAEQNKVTLDANWEIQNLKTHKRTAKLFSTNVATNSDASSIVAAMHTAFGVLEEDVASGLQRFR